MKKAPINGLIDFTEEIADEDKFFAAEEFADIFSRSMLLPTSKSIDIFNFNIKKAKILLGLSYKIVEVWPNIAETITGNEDIPSDSLLESLLAVLGTTLECGSALYFVFTQQSIVTAVSATEIYFRDRLAESINSDIRIANRFANKEIRITIEHLFRKDFQIKKELGNFLVDKIDFQKIDKITHSYGKAFGDRFQQKMFNPDEMTNLHNIFHIRHLIIHKAGKVDGRFKIDTGIDKEIGSHFILSRTKVEEIISFLENIIQRVESMIPKTES